MDPGVAALAGVVIGGLLTAGLEDARERGKERREALASVRILETDLIYVAAALDPVLLGKPWFAPPDGFQLSEWAAQRSAIARWRGLDPDEWTALSQAFDTATQLERHLPDLADDGEILNPPQRELFEGASKRAKLGLGACRYIQRRLTRPWWLQGLRRHPGADQRSGSDHDLGAQSSNS